MSIETIEHRGIIQRIDGGRATVAVETSGCQSCGQGASCGIARIAAGRHATVLMLPATPGLQAGDEVTVVLPVSRLTGAALLGYLFPAVAMLLGAWLGASLDGSDGATALGAMAGFAAALVVARGLVSFIPDALPAPRLVPLSAHPQEHRHDRHR